jgi:hypothetical protein
VITDNTYDTVVLYDKSNSPDVTLKLSDDTNLKISDSTNETTEITNPKDNSYVLGIIERNDYSSVDDMG